MAPQSKSLQDTLYSDLENELNTTRRMLERYPSGHDDWRPHEKSMTLGRLAAHIAELPGYGTMLVTTDEMDFSARDYKPTVYSSAAELLAVFDDKAKILRETLPKMDVEASESTWTLRDGDKVYFSRPRGELIRHMMLNHLVHHRAQLGVYYRMMNVPVPSSYGPSADEGM
ncbi:MAG: DinB family protein [Gemmatimonadota bacterium]|nr:DinB family protein [Gemmatimonadota bacterium]